MSRKLIPQFVIGVMSEVIPRCETHASIDSLFLYANAPGDPPMGSKPVKVQEWLRRVNKSEEVEPMQVLGRIVEKYLDEILPSEFDLMYDSKVERNTKIQQVLERAGLRYIGSGVVTGVGASQVQSLEKEIRSLNVEAIEYEFKRAIENVDADPYEAVSAACNILESVFKVIIQEQKLEIPKVQDLSGLWKVVKKKHSHPTTRGHELSRL